MHERLRTLPGIIKPASVPCSQQAESKLGWEALAAVQQIVSSSCAAVSQADSPCGYTGCTT